MVGLETALAARLVDLEARLRRFAVGLTGSLEAARELVQATLARAVEHLAALDGSERVDAWLFRVAYRLWIDGERRARIRRTVALDAELAGRLGDGGRVLEARTLLADVCRLMARLPEEQRAALLLVAVEGLPYAAAARVLGVPQGTVATRVARARQALKAALESEETGKPATILRLSERR